MDNKVNNVEGSPMPLVSVIMSCYNSAEYIRESIDSVINQTYTNWELVIVDDKSTDDSVSIIKGYKDTRIKLIQFEKNQGAPYARNAGIAAASEKSDYLAILDSDDVAENNRLYEQIEYLKRHPECSIVGSNISFFADGSSKILYSTKNREGTEYAIANIPFSSPLAHSSIVIRRSDFAGWKIYDESYIKAQDYDFLFRAFEDGKKIACLKEILVKYRVRNDSLSHGDKGIDVYSLKVQCRVARLFGIEDTESVVRPIQFCNPLEDHSLLNYFAAVKYYVLLLRANKKKKILSQKALRCAVIRQMYGITRTKLLKVY